MKRMIDENSSACKSDKEYFESREEYYNSTWDNEVYQSREDHVSQRKDELSRGGNALKKLKKIQYFFAAAACSGVILLSGGTNSLLQLDETEKAYMEEMEASFETQDYEKVLEMVIGGPVEWDRDIKIRRERAKHTALYSQVLEKGRWDEQERPVILTEDGMKLESHGTGMGFALQDGKLYYGGLKEGLPEGQGICYSFRNGDYLFTSGNWSNGFVNGYAENVSFGYNPEKGERDGILTFSGTYKNNLADGEMTYQDKSLEEGKYHHLFYYTAVNGRVVLDDRWVWYWDSDRENQRESFEVLPAVFTVNGEERKNKRLFINIDRMMNQISDVTVSWMDSEQQEEDRRPILADGTIVTEEMVRSKEKPGNE